MGKKVVIYNASRTRGIDAKKLHGFKWFYAGSDVKEYLSLKDYLEPTLEYSADTTGFNRFVASMRTQFMEWIDGINRKSGDDIEYWLRNLYDRDPFASSLFIDICYLAFVSKRLRSSDEKLLVVAEDSNLIESLALLAERENARCENHGKVGGRTVRLTIKLSASYLLNIGRHLYRWLLVRLFVKTGNGELKDGKEITIVSTFLLPTNFNEENRFKDIYMPCLNEWLAEKNEPFMIFPVFHNINFKNAYRAIKKIGISKECGFLLMESMLGLGDYVLSFIKQISFIFHKPETVEFNGINISALVKREKLKSVFSVNAYSSRLRYIAVKKMAAAGIKVKRFILWYENQTADKAAIAGVKRFYKDIPVTGAELYVPPHNHLSLFPLESETEKGVTPDRSLVVGRDFISQFSEFNKTMQYEIGPALRYRHVWNKAEAEKHHHERSVVLLLPQSIEVTTSLVGLCAEVLKKAVEDRIHVVIKTHPTVADSLIESMLKEEGITLGGVNPCFSSEPLAKLLDVENLVLTAISGVILEAISNGVQVVIAKSPIGLDLSHKITDEVGPLLRYAYNSNGFLSVYREWKDGGRLSLNSRLELGAKLKKMWFEPVNEENMAKFMVDYRKT